MTELDIKFDELEHMPLEEAKKIIEQMDYENWLEDISETIEGVNYGFDVIDEGDWDDEGKYQYRGDIGILCQYDESWNIVKKYDIAATSSMIRSGSYFTDYYYQYNNLNISQIIQKYIPEQIIPAKTIVTFAEKE